MAKEGVQTKENLGFEVKRGEKEDKKEDTEQSGKETQKCFASLDAMKMRSAVIVWGFIALLFVASIFLFGCEKQSSQSTPPKDELQTEEDLKTKKSADATNKPAKQSIKGKLTLVVTHEDGTIGEKRVLDNLIVNSGENFLVDAFQNLVEPELLRYHGLGTSGTAAAETDTGCISELGTQYNPDNTRATGSLTEGAAANVFRTVATNSVDATVSIAEFCLMSQAATGGGTMWTRVVISPTVGLNSGDSLQTTYDLTVE